MLERQRARLREAGFDFGDAGCRIVREGGVGARGDSNGNGASSDGSSVGTIQLAAHDVAVVDVGAAESATP